MRWSGPGRSTFMCAHWSKLHGELKLSGVTLCLRRKLHRALQNWKRSRRLLRVNHPRPHGRPEARRCSRSCAVEPATLASRSGLCWGRGSFTRFVGSCHGLDSDEMDKDFFATNKMGGKTASSPFFCSTRGRRSSVPTSRNPHVLDPLPDELFARFTQTEFRSNRDNLSKRTA